jgi:hypothetical protein
LFEQLVKLTIAAAINSIAIPLIVVAFFSIVYVYLNVDITWF